MGQRRPEEEPLPPWISAVAFRLGPLLLLGVVYYLLSRTLKLPPKILVPALSILALSALVYFGARLYKPYYVDKQGKCTARGAKQRRECRHFIPGARLGGGCGRLRESGYCRRMR
jgi:hypothetical protein